MSIAVNIDTTFTPGGGAEGIWTATYQLEFRSSARRKGFLLERGSIKISPPTG